MVSSVADEVLARGVEVGRLQLPAHVERRVLGVEAAVGGRVDGGEARGLRVGPFALVALQVARDPELLEPPEVAERPQRRVARLRFGHGPEAPARVAERLLVRTGPAERAVARVHQRERQQVAARAAHLVGGDGWGFDVEQGEDLRTGWLGLQAYQSGRRTDRPAVRGSRELTATHGTLGAASAERTSASRTCRPSRAQSPRARPEARIRSRMAPISPSRPTLPRYCVCRWIDPRSSPTVRPRGPPSHASAHRVRPARPAAARATSRRGRRGPARCSSRSALVPCGPQCVGERRALLQPVGSRTAALVHSFVSVL